MTTPATRWRWMPLAAIVAAAAAFRLVHLGYSHFQGDEIKAQYPDGAGFPDFLFAQRKGPGQFLVTALVRAVTGGYDEVMTRLPFAMASITAVLVMFLLVRREWGRGAALTAAALMASCGLIVAFGRIVQYQSFTMLLVLVSAWGAFGFARRGDVRELHLTGVAFAVGVLFHYDVLTFGPTALGLVAYGYWTHRRVVPNLGWHCLAAAGLAAVITASFYVPYALQPWFQEVSGYLKNRVVAGRGLGTFGRTAELLSLYLPPFYLLITGVLAMWGAVRLAVRRDAAGVAVLFWFASVFTFYMLLGGDPRSHVYNIFLPGLILAGVGVAHLASVGYLVVRRVALGTLGIAYAGSLLFTWQMFIDHDPEHPWYHKRVAGVVLPNLVTRQVEGVFGFPYDRGLGEVGRLFERGELDGTFNSNERDVMADFYFRSARGEPARYYIYVHQALSLDRGLPAEVEAEYRLLRGIDLGGRRTIDIYERVP